MSSNLGELMALPLVIVIAGALIASVWIGGNGGDVSWITDTVNALVIPALFVGFLLASGAAIANGR